MINAKKKTAKKTVKKTKKINGLVTYQKAINSNRTVKSEIKKVAVLEKKLISEKKKLLAAKKKAAKLYKSKKAK